MSKSLKINLIILGATVLILAGAFYNLSIKEVTAQVTSTTYGVSMNNTTGEFSGYAWSDNIGWIKFGNLSSFPSGLGTTATNSRRVGSDVIGWARACAGTVGGKCATMDSRTDGWDGWISLKGTNYGVTLLNDNKTLSGFAWGSDVIGWISFSGIELSSTIVNSIDLEFYASPSDVLKNSSTTIIWFSAGADSCTVTKDGVLWSSGLNGSKFTPKLLTDTDFAISCLNSGNSRTEYITVRATDAPPAERKITVKPGEIDWIVSDAVPGSCVLNNGSTDVYIDGLPTGEYINETLEEGITFTITCDLVGGGTFTATSTQSLPPQPRSVCEPSQNLINVPTTWRIRNSVGQPGNTVWGGTSISGSKSGQTEDSYTIIYTTVGLKTINGTSTITRSNGNGTFISTCSTTTLMKLDAGSSGEI